MIKLKNDHPNLSNCAKITFSWQLTLTFAQSESFLNWIILDRSVQNKQDRTYWRLTFFNTNTHVIELLPTTFDSAVFFWVWTCLLTKKKPFPFSFRKEVWIMDPNTDTYYYWLCTIAIPVFYNLMLLPARSEFMAFCISLFTLPLFRGHYHGFASL